MARFSHDGDVAFGVVEGDEVAELAGHPFGPVAFSGNRRPLTSVRLLAPVLPSKVVAIGKNYADHASEMGGDVPAQPLIFLKPSTAVAGPGDDIAYPPSSQRVDFEGELAVVISRLCRDVPAARAAEVVLGYTCANDVTARDQQKADGQWSRAKGYDSFCPLGPWIETDADPADLRITTTLSGETKQDARTSQIVHKIPDLIAYITACMTLIPGDVILTGTPSGVGPMAVGDEVVVEIEGVGRLANRVVARAAAGGAARG
ncbi:MAG TPA: fumarylacetoacetate hydrolase family protein [Mycobacteriales bacterium]|nr:fumarylacetoacetate hydrolase family protein [Mycobacteriales bacterium]